MSWVANGDYWFTLFGDAEDLAKLHSAITNLLELCCSCRHCYRTVYHGGITAIAARALVQPLISIILYLGRRPNVIGIKMSAPGPPTVPTASSKPRPSVNTVCDRPCQWRSNGVANVEATLTFFQVFVCQFTIFLSVTGRHMFQSTLTGTNEYASTTKTYARRSTLTCKIWVYSAPLTKSHLIVVTNW